MSSSVKEEVGERLRGLERFMGLREVGGRAARVGVWRRCPPTAQLHFMEQRSRDALSEEEMKEKRQRFAKFIDKFISVPLPPAIASIKYGTLPGPFVVLSPYLYQRISRKLRGYELCRLGVTCWAAKKYFRELVREQYLGNFKIYPALYETNIEDVPRDHPEFEKFKKYPWTDVDEAYWDPTFVILDSD